MSATNRGTTRRPLDQYPTPGWVTRLILPRLHIMPGAVILDPCCGTGSILNEVAEEGFVPVGIEIDPVTALTCKHTFEVRDALGSSPWPRVDAIVTNPPFVLAQRFAERALAEIKPGGEVAFLLRVGFLEGKCRIQFWKRHRHCQIYPLARRPAFVENRTDASAYAWFVWGPGRGPVEILSLPGDAS